MQAKRLRAFRRGSGSCRPGTSEAQQGVLRKLNEGYHLTRLAIFGHPFGERARSAQAARCCTRAMSRENEWVDKSSEVLQRGPSNAACTAPTSLCIEIAGNGLQWPEEHPHRRINALNNAPRELMIIPSCLLQAL
eukprot:1157367-Pelagomonas_calceolata.AAC.7